MELSKELLPILSLVVAILAVFIGPMLSLKSTKAQIDSSSKIARKNIVAPIRQNWINELREILAELLVTTTYYWTEENLGSVAKNEYHLRIRQLISKLQLYINPKEKPHIELVESVIKLERLMFGGDNEKSIRDFWEAHGETQAKAQEILKREWERVKNEI